MKQIDFSSDNTRRSVAAAALPMLVAQILSLLYSIVDRIYIGRIPEEGTTALGGIGLCFPFIILITAFTNLYGMGGGPLCAMARGRRKMEEAGRVMNTSYTLLGVTSVLLMVLFQVFATPLLRMFGTSERMMPAAMSYLQIYLLGTPGAMLSAGLSPFINAQGFASASMLSIGIGAVCNILLDPVLIFGFHMGIRGAAIATVVSQYASMAFVLLFLHGPQAELKLRFLSPLRLERRRVTDIVGLGLTAFIMQFTNSLVAVVCNQMLSSYGGDLYVSVYTIINSVRQILDVPVHAITEGASPVLSYNYGARRLEKMKETVRIFSGWAFLYTAVIWVLILVAPGMFIAVFSSDPALNGVAAGCLKIYFAAFIFQSFQYCGQSTFKALGRKRKAIFFSLLRKVIMVVPLTLLLPRLGFGVNGVFLAEPVSNVIGGLACFTAMIRTEYLQWDRMLAGEKRSR